MKLLTTLFLSSISLFLHSQTPNRVESLILGNKIYKVPEGCTAEVESELVCKDYMLQWSYMNDENISYMPDNYVMELESRIKNSKKDTMTLYVLNTKLKGFKISHKIDEGIRYELIGYGIVNEQPLIIQLTLKNDPKKNEDIPEFPRQIIKLTK